MQFKKLLASFLLTAGAVGLSTAAQPLKQATVTTLKNTVRLQPEGKDERDAKSEDTLTGADVLHTGERSFAELLFADKTITRLGSKSIFSFKSEAREFRVGDGLTVIHVPKGAGGGRIVTAAITAAIEGTTIAALDRSVAGKEAGAAARVLSTIWFVEGKGTIFLNRDPKQSRKISEGQRLAQFADDPALGQPVDFHIKPFVEGGRTFLTFPQEGAPWRTADKSVRDAIRRQERLIRRGILRVAGAVPGDAGPPSGGGEPPFRDEGLIGIPLDAFSGPQSDFPPPIQR